MTNKAKRRQRKSSEFVDGYRAVVSGHALRRARA